MSVKAPRKRLVLGLALVSILVAATPATAGVRTCDGKPATIQRGDADNDIFGTPKNDVIVAGGGDDSVNARGGRDRVCGEGGNDEVFGEGASDPFLAGGAGRDFVGGDEGSDVVDGGTDNDGGPAPWRGGQGFVASLWGGDGRDRVFGGRGHDGDGFNGAYVGLNGGAGDDKLFGGRGNDDIDDSIGPRTLDPADVDQVFAAGGDEDITVNDDDSDDFVDCGAGNFNLTSDLGDQTAC